MWKKEEPESILLLEALIRRLPKEEVAYYQFEEKLGREKSGFYGEQRLEREWLDFQIQSRYLLLNGLKFENKAAFTHQIDALFICQYFILVLEAKNIAGRIDMNDETNQCIRTRADGSVEGFTNPIDQVRRHGGFIRGYLRELGILIPVVSAVVFVNPNSIIGQVNVRDVLVFQISGLRYKIERLFSLYRKPAIDEELLQLVAETLIAHRKLDSWRPKYNQSKLNVGVLCSLCHYHSRMRYSYGKWTCSGCGNEDNRAFYEALHDYRLLWGERISKSGFCDYIGINAKKTGYRLLSDLNLETEGANRNRKYIIPANIKQLSNKT